MLKKIICLLLISFSIPYTVLADDTEEILYEEVSSTLSTEPTINSRSAIVFDRASKTILFEKDIHKKRPMASTTKIMTSIIILENCTLSDIVTISKRAAGTGGSRLGLHTNDKVTVHDLLYGLMLRSGNDSAVALAEYASGSVENFAILMNEKAKSLGLNNTNFVTPHGLDNDMHYTTAYELAKLTDYALCNDTFSKIVNTKTYSININGYTKTINNTNELLGYPGVNGVKTGFTGKAGRCLVTSCNRNNFNIITVVLGADTKKDRTNDSAHLIEYVYNKFEILNTEKLVEESFTNWLKDNPDTITINKSNSIIDLKLAENINYNIVTNKSTPNNINVEIYTLPILNSPSPRNSKVGLLKVKNNDETLISVDILLSNDITSKNIKDYFKDFANIFLNLKINV